MKVIRYILTAPAFAIGFLIAFITSLELSAFLVRLQCPTKIIEKNFCYGHPEIQAYPIWIYFFGASLAAILMIILPAMLAPNNKITIATIYYIVGTIYAIFLASTTSDIFPVALSAIISGALTVLAVKYLTNRCTG